MKMVNISEHLINDNIHNNYSLLNKWNKILQNIILKIEKKAQDLKALWNKLLLCQNLINVCEAKNDAFLIMKQKKKQVTMKIWKSCNYIAKTHSFRIHKAKTQTM